MTRSAREALGDVLCDDLDYARVPIGEAADRILSRLSEEGWVVVPREPTDEMWRVFNSYAVCAGSIPEGWRAMIAAIDGEGK